jgi:hypothetical protein
MSVALSKVWVSIGEPQWLPPIVFLLMGIAYELAAVVFAGISPYRPFFDPLFVGIAAVATVFLGTMRIGKPWRPLWLGAVLVFAISADRIGARAALFGHTYGIPPEKLDVIGHYTVEELKVANELRQIDPSTLIISDPYTTSLIRARTGLSALIQYSNLDTVPLRSEQLLRETLSFAEEGNAKGICKGVNELLDQGGEYNYLLARLKPNGSSINAVIVYSARTDKWEHLAPGERISYYPTEASLGSTLISKFSSLGVVEAKVNDEIMAVRVSCGYRDVPRKLAHHWTVPKFLVAILVSAPGSGSTAIRTVSR